MQRIFIVFLVTLSSSVWTSSRYNYYPVKEYDHYGEYYRNSYGYKVYVYCFNLRNKVEKYCKPQKNKGYHSISEYPNGVVINTSGYNFFSKHNYYNPNHILESTLPSSYQSHLEHHHEKENDQKKYTYKPTYSQEPKHNSDPIYNHYDGRGNVNVGKGQYYWRGRDIIIECDFKHNNNIISNIIWYRKSYRDGHLYQRGYTTIEYSNYGSYKRFEVEKLGNYKSRLVIRDYNPYEDAGVYRCFTTRQNYHSYRSKGKETIFKEIELYTKS